MKATNIFASIPKDLSTEIFETLVKTPGIRIERIISGHKSPEHGARGLHRQPRYEFSKSRLAKGPPVKLAWW